MLSWLEVDGASMKQSGVMQVYIHEDFIKAEKEAKNNGLGVWDGN